MKKANIEAVAKHFVELQETLGSETEFLKAYTAMQEDPEVKAPEMKKICKMFAKTTARSKAAALSAIWQRHASLMHARRVREWFKEGMQRPL